MKNELTIRERVEIAANYDGIEYVRAINGGMLVERPDGRGHDDLFEQVVDLGDACGSMPITIELGQNRIMYSPSTVDYPTTVFVLLQRGHKAGKSTPRLIRRIQGRPRLKPKRTPDDEQRYLAKRRAKAKARRQAKRAKRYVVDPIELEEANRAADMRIRNELEERQLATPSNQEINNFLRG